MRLITRIIVIYFIALILVLFMTSCSKNGKSKEALSNDLIMWHIDKNMGQEIIKNYKKVNSKSEINIKIEEVDSDKYNDYLAKIIKSGSDKLPDIIALDRVNLFNTINMKNLLEDLDKESYNIKSINKNMYGYSIVSAKDRDKKQKAIAFKLDPGGIFYKKDLARRFLGKSDEENVTELFQDYESIIETGKKLKDKSGGKCKLFTNTDDLFSVYLAARSHPWLEDGELIIDDELDYFMKLTKRVDELDLDSNIKFNSDNWKNAIKDNIHFAFPMSFSKINMIKEVQKSNLKYLQRWGIIKPQYNYFNDGIWFGMIKKGEKKSLAWDFIKYIVTNKEFIDEYASNKDVFWNNKAYIDEISKDRTLVSDINGGNIYKSFNDIIETKYKNLDTKYDSDINKLFIKYTNSYSENSKDYYEVIDEFREDAESLWSK